MRVALDRGQKNTTAGTSTASTVTSDAFTPAVEFPLSFPLAFGTATPGVVATATAALGGLTATGTGTRTVTGAATAALGALTGAVVVVTADPNPLSVTIRETGHRVVVRESRRRIYIR